MARRFPLYLFLLLAFAANAAVWLYARPMTATWANVPPPPSRGGAVAGALGDSQFAYRTGGLMLQNFGDVGGRTTALDKYDYPMLGRWFMLSHELDPVSNYAPYLAGFYYGSTQKPSELRPLIDYLAIAGREKGPGRWRWLGQAIFLARFKLQDSGLALTLANELAARDEPGLPAWTRQMPAFIMNASGDKASAYQLLVTMLKEEGPHMQKAEVNFMLWYICRRVLDRAEADRNSLCIENADVIAD